MVSCLSFIIIFFNYWLYLILACFCSASAFFLKSSASCFDLVMRVPVFATVSSILAMWFAIFCKRLSTTCSRSNWFISCSVKLTSNDAL